MEHHIAKSIKPMKAKYRALNNPGQPMAACPVNVHLLQTVAEKLVELSNT